MSLETPLFSVVMPAYNAASLIAESIDSVQSQSVQSWELLVIDDGSTDATAQIICRYAALDPRVRLIEGQHRGCGAARNLGMAQARGRFIAFLDADDLWLPEKLHCHLRQFEADPQLGLSFTRARYMSFGGERTRTVSSTPTHGLKAEDFLYENATTTPSTIAVRHEVFSAAGGFDETLVAAEDLEWIIRVLIVTGCTIEGIDAPLTLYRSSPQGLSANLERQQASWERVLEIVRAWRPELMKQHYHAARATHLRYLARRALRLGKGGAVAYRYINAALAEDWRLLLRSPRRTLLTLIAAYGQCIASRLAALFASHATPGV